MIQFRVEPIPATNPDDSSGVYVIYCIRSNRYYIGSSNRVRHRVSQHVERLRKGLCTNQILQKTWDKYGSASFRFFLIFRSENNRRSILADEQRFLDYVGAGTNNLCMNINPTAGSCLGVKRRPETIARMCAAQKGKTFSDETRRKMSLAAQGRKITDEQRRKIGDRSRGRPGPQHTSEQLAKWRKLTVQQVIELRKRRESGEHLKSLAKSFGISFSTTHRIVTGESYAAVRS